MKVFHFQPGHPQKAADHLEYNLCITVLVGL